MDKPWKKIWPIGLTYSLEYPDITIDQMFEKTASWYKNKTAFIFYGNRISYSEAWKSIEKLSGFLSELGIGKGSRVGLMMQNSPNFIISFFSIAKTGATIVLMSPMLTYEDAKFITMDTKLNAIITTGELLPLVLRLKNEFKIEVIAGELSFYLPEKPDLPVPEFVSRKYDLTGAHLWNEIMNSNVKGVVSNANPDDEALIAYTSGTTGIPKGCIHTHRNVIANAMDGAIWRRVTPASVELAVLPFFHVTGLSFSMLSPIYAGATLALLTRWDREAAVEAIEKYRCTHWIGLAPIFTDVLLLPDLNKRDFSSLRFIGGGGASIPKAVAEKLEKLLNLPFVEGYGLTEGMGQTHINPPEKRKLQCIGVPQFGYDAFIIDTETGEIKESGEGEIVVKGPTIFKGYLNNPEETEKAFITINGEKYLRTGDIGYMDEDGSFFVIDRLKRMINRGGYKVWPTEVDAILAGHPAVKEVCVVSTPDPRVGEEVKAYIVLKPDYQGKIAPEDIINWAKDKMAPYKYPRYVEFIDSIPKTASGKINWRLMQEIENSKVRNKNQNP